MQYNLQTEKAAKVASFNGIDVFRIFSEKFKTNTINIFFHDNLRKESVTKNALIPAILRRGCEHFPTFRDIALYLEELFGASFDCGVSKKGERQITQFYIEFVAEKYAGKEPVYLTRLLTCCSRSLQSRRLRMAHLRASISNRKKKI